MDVSWGVNPDDGQLSNPDLWSLVSQGHAFISLYSYAYSYYQSL